jgi:glycosyltransferase involved in cell wall biosynthesis
LKIALVHDWLTGMRGGEKVLLALLELFPDADLFTLVYRPEKMPEIIRSRRVRVSALQKFPGGPSRYQYYLPFYWTLMGGFDLSGYDLIVSSSSACAKWVRNPRNVPHVCYCHAPMRYIWDMFGDYFGSSASWPVRRAAQFFRPALQRRDLQSNGGVSHFIANSTEVQARIRRIYGRDSEVIHPPVDVEAFPLSQGPRDYFLVISALVPYKRIDLAVGACTEKGWPLVVIGTGSELKRLKKIAGPTVQFEGWVADGEMPRYYDRAQALLFPGKEDFGIVPVEALASGCPVIAFGEGGVRDSLQDGVTGVFFQEQTRESLVRAVEKFKADPSPDPQTLHQRALGFSKDHFLLKIRNYFGSRPGLSRYLQ